MLRATVAIATLLALLSSGVTSRAQPAAASLRELVRRLRSANGPERLDAARALARTKSRDALRPLLICAQVDGEESVRQACAAAVRAIDQRAFASKLASADPPPVRKPIYPLRPRARYATLLLLGLDLDATRAAESVGGSAAFGIRWGDVEAQLTLGFPAMSLALRARWLLIRYPRLTPYLSAGATVIYNEGDDRRREALALQAGAGVRFYFIPPIFVQIEALASWAAHAPLREAGVGSKVASRRFALPIMFQAGLELWP